jgi:predicted RNase H-like HicB family nuclease
MSTTPPVTKDPEAVPAPAPAPVTWPGQVFTVEVKVRLQALAIPEPDGGYSVLVPALPGCVTQADTLEEIQSNLIEAAEGWLATGHEINKEEDLRIARGEE